jgi:fidgetin-like protein 1
LLCVPKNWDVNRIVKSEFLLQFDGCNSSRTDRILVLAATNRPADLDDSVLRRFTQRIFIDLPDSAARLHFIQATFEQNNVPTCLSAEELAQTAALTDGYSFSDLWAVCRAAAMQSVQQQMKCSSAELMQMSAHQLRAVNFGDIAEAVRLVHASTSAKNLRRLREFASGAAHGDACRWWKWWL